MNASPVSVYFDDAKKIVDLFAGKAEQPPYDKLNWDAKRVWNLDPKKFAVFGPDDAAKKIADALKAKGMTVEVNPKYEIKPFVREPGRGGAGPSSASTTSRTSTPMPSSCPAIRCSRRRSSAATSTGPSPTRSPAPAAPTSSGGSAATSPAGRTCSSRAISTPASTWLLDAINGKVDAKTIELEAKIKAVEAKKMELPAKLAVGQEIKLYDTPVGVGASPDGKTTYVLLYGGEVSAYGADGKEQWHTQALLEGCNLAVSPKGDRIAVAGYPGLLVLDAKDGHVIGGHKAAPYEKGEVPPAEQDARRGLERQGHAGRGRLGLPEPQGAGAGRGAGRRRQGSFAAEGRRRRDGRSLRPRRRYAADRRRPAHGGGREGRQATLDQPDQGGAGVRVRRRRQDRRGRRLGQDGRGVQRR